MANNYDIDYNDKRFTEVESDKKEALSDLENTYAGMVNESDKYYQAQIDASKQWADKQSQLQQEKTDFAIKEINQQKDQTKKDYIKEQSGAYVDWQKQSNEYGANAEQMAAHGLANTGYSESSQVSMYNTYQNRVATAREAYGRAVLNYDNAITEARMQNNSVLAEIAYEALQQQLELSLQGFQYKNQLLLDKADKKTALENTYYQRYQDVLAQINHENALAEQIRQYNESLAFQREQFAWQQEQANKSSSGGGGGSGGGGSGTINKDSSTASAAVKGAIAGASGIKKDDSSSSGGSFSAKSAVEGAVTGVGKNKQEYPVDQASVLALGYGPISASRLAELQKQGLITSYVSDGKLKFKKSSYAIKQSLLFN